jgi:hypothetical protein
MFYIIFFAAIAFALYLIFHDNQEGEGKPSGRTTLYRPETPAPSRTPSRTPTPTPAVKPPVVPNRGLSWTYLYNLKYDDRLSGDVMETQITGMRYYCGLADVGPVNGIIRPEPTNPHDPRAQMVVRADGKKLGYIPRYALPEYEDFNPDNHVCPFVGQVTVDRKGYMNADIFVALPKSREFVKEELAGRV